MNEHELNTMSRIDKDQIETKTDDKSIDSNLVFKKININVQEQKIIISSRKISPNFTLYNNDKNSITHSTEKTNSVSKKNKLQEISSTLVSTLLRILKNDRIKELSFGFIHNLSYNIKQI